MFPKAVDQHKPNKPSVPNGLGVVYVLASAVYLFLLYFFNIVGVSNGVSAPFTLAVCILFGGFLGLLDDWMDLKWRHKAFLPLMAAIPLISFAQALGLRTAVTIPFLGTVDFGLYYYFLVLPLIVTIITNTVNQLGGLNGLETVCPAIAMVGLMVMSGTHATLLYVPLIAWLALAAFNFQGKIFVGNTGSFAIGMTLASFAIISDLKLNIIVSILPYIFNSSLILLTYFIYRTKASVTLDRNRLSSDHRRSLITTVTFRRPLTERQVVVIISLLTVITTAVAMILQWLRFR